MPDPGIAFAAGLAMTVVAAAALAFFAAEAHLTRQRLKRRVDLIAPGEHHGAGREPPAVTSGPANLLAIAGLHGTTLEFARRVEPFGIRAALALRLLQALCAAGALLCAAALLFVGYYYGAVRAYPSLLGLGILGGALGWRLPHIVLDRLVQQRKRALARGLPDAIELLVIAVEAGLSLEEAVDRIVVELRRSQPAMAQELALSSADLKILPNRDEALRRMIGRVDLPGIYSVVTTLTQTLRYGTPLAQALRVVAAELRDDALMRLEEQVNRLPVLLTIPMILFILPSLFLIILGPASLSMLDTFSHW